MESFEEILRDFYECPVKPLLEQLLQTGVTAENANFIHNILPKLKTHEANVRASRQELEKMYRDYRTRLLIRERNI